MNPHHAGHVMNRHRTGLVTNLHREDHSLGLSDIDRRARDARFDGAKIRGPDDPARLRDLSDLGKIRGHSSDRVRDHSHLKSGGKTDFEVRSEN